MTRPAGDAILFGMLRRFRNGPMRALLWALPVVYLYHVVPHAHAASSLVQAAAELVASAVHPHGHDHHHGQDHAHRHPATARSAPAPARAPAPLPEHEHADGHHRHHAGIHHLDVHAVRESSAVPSPTHAPDPAAPAAAVLSLPAAPVDRAPRVLVAASPPTPILLGPRGPRAPPLAG